MTQSLLIDANDKEAILARAGEFQAEDAARERQALVETYAPLIAFVKAAEVDGLKAADAADAFARTPVLRGAVNSLVKLVETLRASIPLDAWPAK